LFGPSVIQKLARVWALSRH